jgi:hypothetical protein
VQTARVTAASADELPPLLPQLATVLMMTDEQKMAYEQDQARQTAVAVKAVEPAPLPPPPDVPAADDPPPVPIVTATPIAPPAGDLKADDFARLAPPPDGDPVPVVIAPAAEEPVQLRLQQVCIEVGDNLFRRGRFVEANAQFELAFNIGRNRGEVQIRLDRCRPFLPPPVVVVAPPPPRPRLAVLDFTVWGDPDVVPPILGPYTADALAPYFSPPYEVVDREVVCWYMNRMGLTLRDVLLDPAARRWLGRALGVRYFVLGTIEQTHSFVVTTYLVDAETGWVYGSGRIHVRNAFEMKCRLGELAYETMLSPRERERRRLAVEAAERQAERFHEMEEAERWRRLRECDDPDAIVRSISSLNGSTAARADGNLKTVGAASGRPARPWSRTSNGGSWSWPAPPRRRGCRRNGTRRRGGRPTSACWNNSGSRVTSNFANRRRSRSGRRISICRSNYFRAPRGFMGETRLTAMWPRRASWPMRRPAPGSRKRTLRGRRPCSGSARTNWPGRDWRWARSGGGATPRRKRRATPPRPATQRCTSASWTTVSASKPRASSTPRWRRIRTPVNCAAPTRSSGC